METRKSLATENSEILAYKTPEKREEKLSKVPYNSFVVSEAEYRSMVTKAGLPHSEFLNVITLFATF